MMEERNMYQELHDLVHDLQGNLGDIVDGVSSFIEENYSLKKINIKIKVYSNLGSPFIEGKRCSFETKKIRKTILEMIEVNEEFILPKKYDYVITELNGFAKIIKRRKLR